MRYDQPTYLSAATVVLGEAAQTPADAVAAGRLSPIAAERSSYRQLTVSASAAVDLAHRAATAALAAAGVEPLEVRRLFHAWNYHQGHEYWSPADYVATKAGVHNAIPLGIQQMCNGGAAAIELAARELIADPALPLALVTTADRAGTGIDRWADIGVAHGDGATAVLVGPTPCGPCARLLASASAAASNQEKFLRGSAEFSPAPTSGVREIRPGEAKRQFVRLNPNADLKWMIPDVIVEALADAGIKPGGPAVVAVPRFATPALERVRGPVEAAAGAPMAILGQDTGHLGAGDAIANLADLTATGRVSAGDIVVLASSGGGSTWTVLVLRVGA